MTGKTLLSSILVKHTGHTGNASSRELLPSVISTSNTVLQCCDDKPRYRTAGRKNFHFCYLVNPDHICCLHTDRLFDRQAAIETGCVGIPYQRLNSGSPSPFIKTESGPSEDPWRISVL